jgi:hypothetical protein
MKEFVNRVIVLGLIFVSMTTVAIAKPIRKQVTFSEPVKVNGVLVKPGTYDVAFDEEKGELRISKGKRVLAKAPAQLEKVSKDSHILYELSSDDVDSTEPKVLARVGLKERLQAKLLNEADVNVGGVPYK